MKRSVVASLVVALSSVLSVSSALAQPENDGNPNHLPNLKPRADVRADERANELARRQTDRQARENQRLDEARARQERRASERGGGPDRRYHRGDRLPAEYRSRQYVVDDWRGHHLNAPPRGYHWVQSGGDYLLVAIATGIIAELLLNN